MGQADYYAPGDYNAVCYECGFKRKASGMLKYWQGYWLCPEHWNIRQPQDFVRSVKDVQTPPWQQPRPAYTYLSTAPTIYYINVETEGPFFTFTPDFSWDGTGTAPFITITTPNAELGPYPLNTTVTEGTEVVVVLTQAAGTGTATGENGRLEWTSGGTLYEFTLTCGYLDAGDGAYIQGYDPEEGYEIGSLSPTAFLELPVVSVASAYIPDPLTQTTSFAVTGELAASSVTSLSVNGYTLLASDATYAYAGGYSSWTWNGIFIPASGTYTVTILGT